MFCLWIANIRPGCTQTALHSLHVLLQQQFMDRRGFCSFMPALNSPMCVFIHNRQFMEGGTDVYIWSYGRWIVGSLKIDQISATWIWKTNKQNKNQTADLISCLWCIISVRINISESSRCFHGIAISLWRAINHYLVFQEQRHWSIKYYGK